MSIEDDEDEFVYTEDYFETKVCEGDWLGGLSIDILKYCGMSDLSPEQADRLWDKYTDIALMRACDDCFMVKTGEFDEIPGQSTEYFSFMTDREEELKSQLRALISEAIQSFKPTILDPANGTITRAMHSSVSNKDERNEDV